MNEQCLQTVSGRSVLATVVGFGAVLSCLISTSSYGDGADACISKCNSEKYSCVSQYRYTNCPGTGLFGDPQFAAHQACVRRIDQGKRECAQQAQECLSSCDSSSRNVIGPSISLDHLLSRSAPSRWTPERAEIEHEGSSPTDSATSMASSTQPDSTRSTDSISTCVSRPTEHLSNVPMNGPVASTDQASTTAKHGTASRHPVMIPCGGPAPAHGCPSA